MRLRLLAPNGRHRSGVADCGGQNGLLAEHRLVCRLAQRLIPTPQKSHLIVFAAIK